MYFRLLNSKELEKVVHQPPYGSFPSKSRRLQIPPPPPPPPSDGAPPAARIAPAADTGRPRQEHRGFRDAAHHRRCARLRRRRRRLPGQPRHRARAPEARVRHGSAPAAIATAFPTSPNPPHPPPTLHILRPPPFILPATSPSLRPPTLLRSVGPPGARRRRTICLCLTGLSRKRRGSLWRFSAPVKWGSEFVGWVGGGGPFGGIRGCEGYRICEGYA